MDPSTAQSNDTAREAQSPKPKRPRKPKVASPRRFYLRDPEGSVVPGTVGLATAGDLEVVADGVIPIDGLDAAAMEELERMAATVGHPVTEGEPEGVK